MSENDEHGGQRGWVNEDTNAQAALEVALAAHRRFVASGGTEGTQLDLSGVDLSRAKTDKGTILPTAVLTHAERVRGL